jgi:hypothetical protein
MELTMTTITKAQIKRAQDNYFAISEQCDLAYDAMKVAGENYDAALSGGSEEDCDAAYATFSVAYAKYNELHISVGNAYVAYRDIKDQWLGM